MKIKVEMPQKIINNRNNWTHDGSRYYMSNHMYRGTMMEVFESIDDCRNCDGAWCDGCVKIEIPPKWSISPTSDDLYNALIEDGVDKQVASDLAYNDFGSKTHYLNWDYEIPEDVLKDLTTPDKEIFNWMEMEDNYTEFVHNLARKYCMEKNDLSEYKYVEIQMELYRKMKKEGKCK